MTKCDHRNADFVGEQKTDEGVNTFLKCHSCLSVIVITPEKKVFAISAPSRAR
ncbi:MAG: hypothetical protein LYZ69_09565 [Nitrososphaerales archaeon]|nr:hypothetical protein [Nitrososphaerales archaeon]